MLSKQAWVRKLLKSFLIDIDIEREVDTLKEELKTAQGQRRNRAIKRLEVMEAFRNSKNLPGWMVTGCTSCYSA